MPVTIGGSGPITGVTSINTTVSDTELGYLDGVSSALQTQINGKANDSSQGLYLITPTSIANSGGSASASGGAVTFTGVNSVSLNGVFTSTYANYRIVIANAGNQAPNVGMRIRMRASGTDATGAEYIVHQMYTTNTGGPSRTYAANDTFATIGSIGNYFDHYDLDMHAPALSEWSRWSCTGFGISTSDSQAGIYSGAHFVSSSYDGITLYPSAGTMTGTVRVYGYKN